MVQERGRSNPRTVDGPSERTALLAAPSGHYSHHGATQQREDGDGDEIDPNEFDLILSRSESITTGIGVEIESQETAMLRGPRKYSSSRKHKPILDQTGNPGKTLGASGNDNEAILGQGEENSDTEADSPFLAGVSVARFWFIFSGVLTTYFVCCFDSTIMVSSHPVITSYFHSSNSASWLSTAFLLTSTSFQPLFGRLSDSLGRKIPYLFTMMVFVGATLWCALAQSMLSFIMARALCGLGAGGVMSLGSIITSDLVPIQIRGTYQSYINIVFGIGSALGAALGGAIADHLGWRWEFGIQLPGLLTCLSIAILSVPHDLGLAKGVKRKTLWEAMKVFDFKGSLLLTTTITSLILGLNLGGNVYLWSHPIVITALVFFLIGFPLFIYVESTVELPIMPLRYLYHNPHAALILSNSIGAVVVNSVIFNIPLYFQAVLLESATTSGLRLIVSTIAASIVGTATGFYITWSKQLKIPLVLGVVFLLGGTILYIFMDRHMPNWAFILFLIPSNIGQGFMYPATFIAILAVSEQAEQAVVTSTLVLWRSMGLVLGVAISSLVLQNSLYYYLELLITGPDREHVIQAVRKSVTAISKLDPMYKEQAINSYAAALRSTFAMAAFIAVVPFVLTVMVKVPKLGQRK
ncbi:MFS general substrate transporter [Glarea lozoyensis ATCC 20868]|uniref:MFS general substrate transporter n=1 Tax=Glarea lozoyensis (strain ATCC 20868 / MF5171) TaxID=1116229 RepID=S3CTU2_GLAL2|nr:MFS general substrate transporter [Glarea lozoyensis ATCC 20868]EPE28449.1 MFS general substrate transporter [Glarea lozoyensis ATCC 20868]